MNGMNGDRCQPVILTLDKPPVCASPRFKESNQHIQFRQQIRSSSSGICQRARLPGHLDRRLRQVTLLPHNDLHTIPPLLALFIRGTRLTSSTSYQNLMKVRKFAGRQGLVQGVVSLLPQLQLLTSMENTAQQRKKFTLCILPQRSRFYHTAYCGVQLLLN
jgi:hypothetical protein